MDTIKKSHVYYYIHLNQIGTKFDFLRKKYGDKFDLCCWFATLVMAADALLEEYPSDDLFEKFNGIINNLKHEEIEDIIKEICQSPGKLNVEALRQILSDGLITFNAGINYDYIYQYPNEFIKFTNKLFKTKKIPLIAEILVNAFKINPMQIYEMMEIKINSGFVPLVGVDAILPGGKHSDHMIMLGGVTSEGMFISDCNRDMPILIDKEMMMDFLTDKVFTYYDKSQLLINDKSVIIFIKRRKKIRVKLLD